MQSSFFDVPISTRPSSFLRRKKLAPVEELIREKRWYTEGAFPTD
jgi:hypothetical protein